MTDINDLLETTTYRGALLLRRRRMAGLRYRDHRLLEALRTADDEIRLFFPISPPLNPAVAAIRQHRLRGASCLIAAPDQLLADLDGLPARPEAEIFAGRDVVFAQRIDEDPTAIADILRYHHRAHGMTGALILNRNPTDGMALAEKCAEILADLDLSVVIWEADFALGRADRAAQSHLSRAPDAPKRRQPNAPTDPWRAKLQQPWLYEAARWRFLAQARRVLMAEACDILSPDPKGFFNQDHEFLQGILPLYGDRIYPWRWRKQAGAGVADHICQRFDADARPASWMLDPAAITADTAWKRPRMAKPSPAAAVHFHRAMALRHPQAQVQELVAKTSLILIPDLLERAKNHFHHSPITPPRPQAAPLCPPKARTLIITTMKNEGPFILEWIAHHRAIGVEDFLIYTNDCSDGTTELLDLLHHKGVVIHRENPWKQGDGIRPQHRALQAAEAEAVLRDCAWAICMDVDEFITIKIGDGTLPALYHAMGDANMISFTWRLFGNAETIGFDPAFVTSQFTRCAPQIIRKPHQAWGFKTLFRNMDLYRKLGVHRPKGIRPDRWAEIRWLNGSGQPMPREMLRNGWRSSVESYGYDWVQLNHYAVRSVESFLVKRDRGRVNHIDRDQGLSYWFCMNHNAEEDLSIAKTDLRRRAEFDDLLADPAIAQAHQHCIHAHRAKIAALLSRAEPRAMLAELSAPRLQKLCRLQQHFGASVFAKGPHAVPDDLDLSRIAADFFYALPTEAPLG